MSLQIQVDRDGSPFPRADGGHNGSWLGNGISPGKDLGMRSTQRLIHIDQAIPANRFGYP